MYNKSEGYISFIRAQKKEKKLILILQLSLLFVFAFIWEYAARLGWINAFITSSPSQIIKTILAMFSNSTLLKHIAVTMLEVLVGFVSGMLLGTVIAVIFWWAPRVAKVLDPYVVVLNALPKVALGPLIIIWVGAGIGSIIIMTLAISLITTVIGVYAGFMQTPEEKIILLKSFGANKAMIFKHVVFPANISNFISCLKINIGLTWVGAIMGEFLVSKSGIGYLIMYGSQVFNLNLVMCGVVTLSVCAAATYLFVVAFEKFFTSKYE